MEKLSNTKSALLQILLYAREKSPFYQKRLANIQINEEELENGLLESLPFTLKSDLAENNITFMAVSRSEVAEYVTTSGTAGNPITIYLTKQDLKRLAKNEKSSLELAGVTKNDIVQLMTTIDRQFMAGLAYYLGVQEIGAGMVRVGPGVPALQWKSIIENQVTTLIAVPSFIISLIDFAQKNNIDYRHTGIKRIICIGEPLREENFELNVLGNRIKSNWDVELYSTYASTEIATAFTECSSQEGGHLNEDLAYLEVIKEDGTKAKDGELGEIVITTLQVEGTPLIRYKTGDLARLHTKPCSCGRTSPRVGPIVGRKNQMIKFKGTTIFPKAIYDVFDNHQAITCYKVEIAKDYLKNDTITVLLDKKIESNPVMKVIVEDCQAKLRVVPHFVFLDEDYIRSQVYKKGIRKPEKILFKS